MKQIKINKAFYEAKMTDKRYRVLYGGAGSGKSHFVAQEILLNMMNNPDHSYLAVRKTGKSIRLSVFKLLVELINENGWSNRFKVNSTEMSVTCFTGSSLVTSGLDDVEKLKSIANVNRIWIEEANEVTERDFTQLSLRMRGTSTIGYQMTLTFNPVSELHWLKRRFFDIGDDQAYVLKTTYEDNVFIDEEYKATLISMKDTDPEYYKIYALGDWGAIGNLIYRKWKKKDLSEMQKTFDNFHNGLDFGFAADPTAFIRVHLDKKRKKIYVTEELYLVEEHIDDLSVKLDGIIGQEYITCDSSEPRSIDDLERRGIRALGAEKGPGSVAHGIKWLQGHEIIVDNSCTNMISELTSYKWKENKNGDPIAKPVDEDNHLLDALRYGLESEMTEQGFEAFDIRKVF